MMLAPTGHDLGEKQRPRGPSAVEKPMALVDGVVVAVAALRINEPGFWHQTELASFWDDGEVHGLVDLVQTSPPCLRQEDRTASKERAATAFLLVALAKHGVRHRGQAPDRQT